SHPSANHADRRGTRRASPPTRLTGYQSITARHRSVSPVHPGRSGVPRPPCPVRRRAGWPWSVRRPGPPQGRSTFRAGSSRAAERRNQPMTTTTRLFAALLILSSSILSTPSPALALELPSLFRARPAYQLASNAAVYGAQRTYAHYYHQAHPAE